VQTERRTKRKTKFFVFYPEVPPIFAAGSVVQTERRTKRKTKFFVFYPEVPPIFAALLEKFKWKTKNTMSTNVHPFLVNKKTTRTTLTTALMSSC